MADIDHGFTKALSEKDRWEIAKDEHNPLLNAKKVEVVGGNVTLDVGDIQIGAVELKDAETGNRASIDSSGALKVDISKDLYFQNLLISDLEENGTVTYIGKVSRNGIWFLQKILDTSGDLTVTYANISNNNGQTTYDLAWANRASLTYTRLHNLTF